MPNQIDFLFSRIKYYKYMKYYYENTSNKTDKNKIYIETLATTNYPFQNNLSQK